MSQYSIVITIADEIPQTYLIDQKLTVGESDKNNIVISGKGLAPRQCIFKVTNDVLSIHNMGGRIPTQLGAQVLAHGKMYIIDDGDKIKLNESIQIEVQKDVAVHEEDQIDPDMDEDSLVNLQKQMETQESLTEADDSFEEITIARIIQGDLTEEEASNLDAETSKKPETPDPKKEKDMVAEIEEDTESFEIEEEIEVPFEEEVEENLLEETPPEVQQTEPEQEEVTEEFEDEDVVFEEISIEAVKNEADDEDGEEAPKQTIKDKLLGAIDNFKQTYEAKKQAKLDKKELEKEEKKAKKASKSSSKKKEKKEEAEPSLKVKSKQPGIFLRGCALAANIGIAYSIFMYLGVDNFLSLFLDFVPKAAFEYASQDVFLFIFTLITFDIISHFIFATSLPLYFMGVKEESTFLTARIKGFARAILGYLTLPFIVFDLPLFLDRKTVKETITKSNLVVRNNLAALVIALIIVPVFGASSILMPFITDLSAFDKQQIQVTSLTKKSKKAQAPNYNSQSSTFSLNIKNYIHPKYVFIPEVRNVGKNLRSILHVIDSNKESSLSFEKENSVNLHHLIHTASNKNPLFGVNYIELHNFVNGDQKQLSGFATKELQTLFKNALSLNLENLITTFQSHGPFFYGLIDLQRVLLEYLSPNVNPKISFYEGADAFFIVAEPNKPSSKNTMKILMVKTSSMVIYSVNYRKKSQRMAQAFPRFFLKGLRPYKKRKKASDAQWSAFESTDLLVKLASLKEEDKEVVTAENTDKMVTHYFNMAKQALEGNNQQYYSTLKKSLEKTLRHLTRVDSNTNQDALVTAKEGLTAIYEALSKKNKYYFNQN